MADKSNDVDSEVEEVMAEMQRFYGSRQAVLRNLLDIFLRLTTDVPRDIKKKLSLGDLCSLWLSARKARL